MRLRFRGARPDGAPGSEISNVLGRDRVQHLRGRGQAQIKYLAQKTPGKTQARGDVMRAVEVRVHDQPLPTHRGARLLEIHPHDHEQLPAEFPIQDRQPLSILATRFEVVDRARPHDDEEPAVFAGEHAGNGISRSSYQGGVIIAAGNFFAQFVGRGERSIGADVEIGDANHVGRIAESWPQCTKLLSRSPVLGPAQPVLRAGLELNTTSVAERPEPSAALVYAWTPPVPPPVGCSPPRSP